MKPYLFHGLARKVLAMVAAMAGRLLLALGVLASAAPAAHALDTTRLHGQPLGQEFQYFVETPGQPLSLSEAITAIERHGHVSRQPILSLGMNNTTLWVRLPLDNPVQLQEIDLLIENPWIDQLSLYHLQQETLLASAELGDRYPYPSRSYDSRFFVYPLKIPNGASALYLRISTPDPIVLPLFLLPRQALLERERTQHYGYGFLYGYLFALLAYNLILYINLRERQLLYYCLFLGAFNLLNIAYTGHGFAFLWPESPTLQAWISPMLLICSTVFGLLFCRSFLNMASTQPRLHTLIGRGIMALIGISLLAVLVARNQQPLLNIALASSAALSVLMPGLGILTRLRGLPVSPYYLLATLSSCAGKALTTLSVWGALPFSNLLYRSVEIGMVVDATLLAIALGHSLRTMKTQGAAAEALAARDPLTNLYNRRAFVDLAERQWRQALRYQRPISLIMFDIDHFKSINDRYGHNTGDTVLIRIAAVLDMSSRELDLAARWGGEEFLLLLPETDLERALLMAERLRREIAAIELSGTGDGDRINISASFGVVERSDHSTLESLIMSADKLLYAAKENGRNCIMSQSSGAGAA